MGTADWEKILELQKKPERVRNICILAHVDHGKTTIADSLLACNGIISGKLAGKLRYMDSRKDEQERGITMKSSAITLLHCLDGYGFLINLIDSPGHVDFSSEVSTAVRLCDGAIVVVDVVEGVCAQTKVALEQAWMENIRPILVLNKIDRLILELQLSPLDAYYKLMQALEQVNAVMAELFTKDILSKEGENVGESFLDANKTELEVRHWSSGLEEANDEHVYFSPDQENVIFASAIDGWAFSVRDFARIYSKKLNLSEELLRKTLWGDYYYHAKTNEVLKGAQFKAKTPIFVKFILDNIWALYDVIAIRKDKEKLDKILINLGIKLAPRDLRHSDCKVKLQAVCSQWLPLAKSVLDTVCLKLPSPKKMSRERAEQLMSSAGRSFDDLPPESRKLREAFMKCDSSEEAPVIVFISKMFPVEKKNLPEFRPKPLTAEELAERRELARKRHEARLTSVPLVEHNVEPVVEPKEEEDEVDDHVFVAFARVFSGTIKEGQELFVLGPKHDPSLAVENLNPESITLGSTLKDLKKGVHVTKVKIDKLYLLMGRELQSLREVPSGNIVGIGNLEEHVLKSATLSNTILCPSFSEIKKVVVPIMRVAVEPSQPSDLPQLIKGLKLLNQADAAVQVYVQETGEHVIVTDGEVHLQRCIDDLMERYAKIQINISEPIVPFRETVVPPPTVDMVNQAIEGQNSSQTKDLTAGCTELSTANKQCYIAISAGPLPSEVTNLLEKNADLLKVIDGMWSTKEEESPENLDIAALHIGEEGTGDADNRKPVLSEKTLQQIEIFKNKLKKAFENADKQWRGYINRIWCFGPRKCGPNILFNLVDGYKRSVWQPHADKKGLLYEYDSSFCNGFQLATLAGPLCEEPMMGVAFYVEKWTISEKKDFSGSGYGPLSGQIMSCVKEGCRKAFQAEPQRLMAAMYSCTVQVNSEVLGKMYAVLGRRHGRVLHGDMTQGSSTFSVTAVLPVVESFSFASEIRKQTSGLAVPQLVFSHWEVIDEDPFWTPRTEEEYLHYGEKGDSINRAKQYMNAVRRRKGLAVEEKIVEFAEKQRTLSKNK